MNHSIPAAIAAMIMVLPGCGGTSTGAIDLSTIDGQLAAIDAVRDEAPFDPRDLSATGLATYAGAVSVFHTPDDALLGTLEMSVDLTNDTFDGAADGFRDIRDTPFAGTLDVTEGIIDRDGDFASEFSATALISGDLSSSEETVSVNGFVVGDFAGSDGQYYRGFLRIGLNGETYQDGDEFGGIVGAQRQ